MASAEFGVYRSVEVKDESSAVVQLVTCISAIRYGVGVRDQMERVKEVGVESVIGAAVNVVSASAGGAAWYFDVIWGGC